MPDTGAPWNIPYVENADLVSDWPADSLLVANAVAAGLSAAGGLVAVHYALKTDVFSESVAARPTVSGAVTGLSVTLTPSDASNDLIVLGTIQSGRAEDAAPSFLHLFRDGVTTAYRGDTYGSRQRVAGWYTTSIVGTAQMNIVFRVSAGSTSSTTFDVRLSHGSTSTTVVYVNRERSTGYTDAANVASVASGLLVMEVKV